MRDLEAFETERHRVLFSSGSSRKIGNVVQEWKDIRTSQNI